MKHFGNVREAYEVCASLGSEVRLEILELILRRGQVNLGTLAKSMHLTNGALTSHIKKLEDAGLIRVTERSGKRGKSKVCSPAVDKLLIDVSPSEGPAEGNRFEIKIGSYSRADVSPYCGLASDVGYIGERDDARYFTYPESASATALWLRSKSLTYTLPDCIKKGESLKELRLSFEISPKGPGDSAPDSRLEFLIGETPVGVYALSSPDAPPRRGALTPSWYAYKSTQYGRLIELKITREGTFTDGLKLSDVSVSDIIPSEFTLKTESGFMLYGSSFGDYGQDIIYNASCE